MTLDPSFEFNPNMETQSREREATLIENCVNDETQWSLTLGKGTGRDGETVINGVSLDSLTTVPVPVTLQSSVRSAARTSGDALPAIQVSNEFERLSLDVNGEALNVEDGRVEGAEGTVEGTVEDESSSDSFLGGVSHWWIYITIVLIGSRRLRFKS